MDPVVFDNDNILIFLFIAVSKSSLFYILLYTLNLRKKHQLILIVLKGRYCDA